MALYTSYVGGEGRPQPCHPGHARPLIKDLLSWSGPCQARWSSLDSITGFGWSGSAMVGGLLIDRYSYSWTFLIVRLTPSPPFSLSAPSTPRVCVWPHLVHRPCSMCVCRPR